MENFSGHKPASIINAVGAIAAIGYIASAILSYFIAPAISYFEGLTPSLKFYEEFTGIPLPKIFERRGPFLLGYMAPLVLPTVAVAFVMLWIMRSDINESHLRLIRRWSYLFAVVGVVTLPVLAQDFWLPASWGTMLTQGMNPYYTDMPANISADWNTDTIRMTYGPLVAVASAGLMWIIKTPWVAFFVFKFLLLACWAIAFRLIVKMNEGKHPIDQALGLFMAGWLPLGVTQALAEGHIDIVMAMFVMLWLQRPRPILLMAAICTKYAVGPLLLIAVRMNRSPLAWLIAIMFTAIVFGSVYRGPGFMSTTLTMQNWPSFLTLGDALAWMGGTASNVVSKLAVAIAAGMALWQWWRHPTRESEQRAAIAIVAATAYGIVGHLWPWFIVWAILPAALQPRWWISRITTGLALLGPFVVTALNYSTGDWRIKVAAVVLWSSALAWFLITRRLSHRALLSAPSVSAAV